MVLRPSFFALYIMHLIALPVEVSRLSSKYSILYSFANPSRLKSKGKDTSFKILSSHLLFQIQFEAYKNI